MAGTLLETRQYVLAVNDITDDDLIGDNGYLRALKEGWFMVA